MGMYATAVVFFGIGWEPEHAPKAWADEYGDIDQERFATGDDDYDIDVWEMLADLLKEHHLDTLLGVGGHGNSAYDYGSFYVYAKGTAHRASCGELTSFAKLTPPSDEQISALVSVCQLLGEDPTQSIGWKLVASYG